MKLTWPRAETNTHYISMGTDVDLTHRDAGSRSRRWSTSSPPTKKMDKHQAYQLTSIAGDVAITQLVDGTMGVHVKMPKSIFKVTIVQRVQWVQRCLVRLVLRAARRVLVEARRRRRVEPTAKPDGCAARRHHDAAWRSLAASRRHGDDERRDALRSGVRSRRASIASGSAMRCARICRPRSRRTW